MADFPIDFAGFLAGQHGIMSTGGLGSPAAEFNTLCGNNFVNTVNLGANVAVYIPVLVQVQTTVAQFGWINGATITSNVDVGLYDWAGNRLVSTGAVAQSGASAAQVQDVTDTAIGPGVCFLAISQSTNTGLLVRSGSIGAAVWRACGARSQTSAHPLPSTATFAAANIPASLPLVYAGVQGAIL